MNFLTNFLFDDVDKALKKIAIIIFRVLLILGIIMLIIGLIKVFAQCSGNRSFFKVMSYTLEDYAYGLSNGYDWFVDGYTGKTMLLNGLYTAIASLCSLPLYGFGVLIEEVKRIRLLQENKNTEK